MTDLKFDKKNFIDLNDSDINFNIDAESEFFKFKFSRAIWKNIPYIKIFMHSKKKYRLHNPLTDEKALETVAEKLSEFPEFVTIEDAGKHFTFTGDFEYLNSKEWNNIFRDAELLKDKDLKRIYGKKLNAQLSNFDKEWRRFLDKAYREKPLQKTFITAVIPVAESLGDDEFSFRASVENLFDSLKNLSAEKFFDADAAIFTMPYDVYAKFLTEIKNRQLENRLINYGEHFFNEDSRNFGNYKLGLIPVTMTDVNSIQRLIKVVKMHMSKNFLEGDFDEKICPNCGSKKIIMMSDGLKKCNDCKIIWGDTQCANENCRKFFKWIKLSADPGKIDFTQLSNLELILLKENMFGATTIVDFDFELSGEGAIRFVPRCPHCGFSNIDSIPLK